MVKKCFIEVPKGGEEQEISAYTNMPMMVFFMEYLEFQVASL